MGIDYDDDDDNELVSNFDILFLHRDVVQSKLENLGQVILLVCVFMWICVFIFLGSSEVVSISKYSICSRSTVL